MIKKPFFGLARPRLKYPVVAAGEQDAVTEIPLPQKVTLFLKNPDVLGHDLIIKAGDKVRTGQKLRPREGGNGYLISTATGTISGISQDTGYLGKTYTAISIDTDEKDQWDDEFNEVGKMPTRQSAVEFFGCLPGGPDFSSLLDVQPPVHTMIVNGMDKDLLITTNQHIVKTEVESLREGMGYLEKITGVDRVIMTVPPDLAGQAEKTGAEVKVIRPIYPDILPRMIMKKILGVVVPPGKGCEEGGVAFINAEAVVAVANAFTKGEIPVYKRLTIIDKDFAATSVRARIGTPVKDILNSTHIEAGHGDSLVLGGPMTGQAIFSEDIPVLSDTDAIMVQDKDQIAGNSDTHCINCGECVRVCPARVPVNMLVRFLENGLYEEAADQYDLHSCIECGLCSYVCTARIPVFHYIMLGKHEFARTNNVEESNG